MSQTAKSPKAFTYTEAMAAHRRVKLTSASGTAVEYADQSDSNNDLGTTLFARLITESGAIELKGAHTTFKGTAADSFSAGATLYAADDGKISDVSSGNAIGTALEPATTDGDIVEWIADGGEASSPGAKAIADYSATDGGVPFIIKALCTAVGAEDETVIASFPRKALVVRAWMIARDTSAANVTIKNATNAITGAVAKGTVDDALIPFDKIIAEYDEIALGAAVITTWSAAGSADIFLLCVAIT